jgi:hypothetical protein
MGMPELTGDINDFGGSSPKNIAAIAALRLYEKYFDYMSTGEHINIDRMTAALLISCTETQEREKMWNTYRTERKRLTDEGETDLTAETTASVLAVGKWYEFMSKCLGLTEQSIGGW